jgi:predicted ATPase
MIRHLKFENFCSFREKGELGLTTSAKTPTDDSFAESVCGDKVTVLAGVFGPNAAGKTNLLKLAAFLNFFLRHSYPHGDADGGIPVDSFAGREGEPTHLEMEFEGAGRVYRYAVTLTRRQVLEERLSLRNPATKSFRVILRRQTGARGAVLTQEDDFTDLTTIKNLLKERPNSSMVSAGLVTGRPEFKQVMAALGRFETNVDRMGKAEVVQGNRTSEVIRCGEYLRDNPHFVADIEARLKAADLGISALRINEVDALMEKTGETRKIPMPFVAHRSGDMEFEIPLSHESAGTKRLFVMLRTFLPVLTDGGVAVIDEMESDLHPHLIPLLLDLFVDRNTNPKRAQLLFTCHHMEILNQLSKEQIVFVQKNHDNLSHVRRLCDLKGVRREENFFANYNAGRYDAVPEPERF